MDHLDAHENDDGKANHNNDYNKAESHKFFGLEVPFDLLVKRGLTAEEACWEVVDRGLRAQAVFTDYLRLHQISNWVQTLAQLSFGRHKDKLDRPNCLIVEAVLGRTHSHN